VVVLAVLLVTPNGIFVSGGALKRRLETLRRKPVTAPGSAV